MENYNHKNYKHIQELFKQGLKFCPCCEKIKSLDLYSKDSGSGLGVGTYCKKCVSKKHQQKVDDEIKQRIDSKRNTEWFQNYLKKKNGKLKPNSHFDNATRKKIYQSYYNVDK